MKHTPIDPAFPAVTRVGTYTGLSKREELIFRIYSRAVGHKEHIGETAYRTACNIAADAAVIAADVLLKKMGAPSTEKTSTSKDAEGNTIITWPNTKDL